ncbi:hypothetical protein ACFE04_023532 [Oxalis oulophora]
MVESTLVDLEMIMQAVSNFLFNFCFYNLIIVMILIFDSKPSSDFDQDSQQTKSALMKVAATQIDESRSNTDESECDTDEEDEVEDDELKERVEDFIAKDYVSIKNY